MNKVMGTAEVAERLGWSKQHVVSYLSRAKVKGFPPGMFPKPFQRIASGWLWLESDIDAWIESKTKKEDKP